MYPNEVKPILVTGGAGFIGSNFVNYWLARNCGSTVNLDKLTYAGNLRNLDSIVRDGRHVFVRADIGDMLLVRELLAVHRPRAIVNFAAESHVDRSIHGPANFIETNVVGTFRLLEEVRAYWMALPEDEKRAFRFLHVSTDEVYGSLNENDPAFTERVPYAPNSPYSASKAAADHWVRACHHTYGLPTLTTNCSNNYGPYQFPEKLIPFMILNAVQGKPLPIYGDGCNIRDWLYVEDHCEAICQVLERGRVGETYNIGGGSEKTNFEVVHTICDVLDELRADSPATYRPLAVASHSSLITFVQDRPGHDRRYAVDTTKIRTELGWKPRTRFEEGIRSTVCWYLENHEWVEHVTSGQYRNWVELNYARRAAASECDVIQKELSVKGDG